MKTRLIVIGLAWALAAPAWAQDAKKARPASLKELLEKVKGGWKEESSEIKQREAEFLAAKNKQALLLKQARATLAKEQKHSENMEKEFDKNEALVPQLEETLKTRLGTMAELFGVIRQAAGDARVQLDNSMVSTQFPGRGEQLAPLTQSKTLPSIQQLELLWYLLQQEMIESGKVVKYRTDVVTVEGTTQPKEVIRVGPFNALAEGKYLFWNSDVGELRELGRQPSERFLETVTDLEKATSGYVRLAVDPSKGVLLSLLVQTPSFMERIHFGGVIGYIIIGLGLATLFMALLRLAYLVFVGLKLRMQQRSDKIKTNNPLGRILDIYQKNPGVDTETLESRLDEAILRESAKLNRFLWAIKIVSVVAPLLGLLGTVTGMIQTFQSITMYGTGDPKMMAGGISEALVTTMLGLIMAIPLVLLHAWMSSMSQRMVEVLEEQSTGMIAKRREEICGADTAG